MKYEKTSMLEELNQNLTLKDKILLHFFKDYTYRVYKKGIRKGFYWNH